MAHGGRRLSASSVGQRIRVNDWIAVFSGAGAAARDLAVVLETQGLRCFVDDREGPIVDGAGLRASFSVVLVPPEESERALAVQQNWEAQNKLDVQNVIGRIRRVIGLSLVPPLAWVFGHALMPNALPQPKPAWLAGLWFLFLALVGQLENRRYQREHVRMPTA